MFARMAGRFRPSFAALPLVLLLPACTRARLESEWEVTVGQLAGLPLEVADRFPADGGTGIGHQVDPYILLNRPLDDREQGILGVATVTDVGEGGGSLGSPELDSDKAGLFLRLPDLRRDATWELGFALPTSLGAEPDAVIFDTVAPEGAAFNMSTGLVVQAFGGNPDHARMLADRFEPGIYPLWVLQIPDPALAVEGQPWRTDLVFAPGRREESGEMEYYLRREYGYVGRFADVVVGSGGAIDHRQEGLFLPLWSSEEVILLYLEDVHLQGQVRIGAQVVVEDLALDGMLTTRWLLRLAEEGGAWADAVYALDLDQDANGNGRPDSASFGLSSAPSPVAIDEIDL